MMLTSKEDQEGLPYKEIPEYDEPYNAGTVTARMIDGLGFRYYWATEGLEEKDLNYKPCASARSTFETTEHILGLSRYIINAALKRSNTKFDAKGLTFSDLRTETLLNLKQASDQFKMLTDLSDHDMMFKYRDIKYPFWNIINGPIEDALWHCGQIVVFRRSSGNPINSNISVLAGKIRS